MPDIFVPVSRDTLPIYYIQVSRNNILYRYTIEYSDRHREELAAVEDFADLEALFAADEDLVDDFVKYAAKSGYTATPSDIEKSRDLLERQLRAFIGRNTKLEDNGYYINIYPLDDALMRALDHLSQIPTDSLNL